MKLIFTILLVTLTKLSFAFIGPVTVYVANGGSDANDGSSPATAWKTIAKVNSTTFYPGSKILFNSGDTWNEKLVPPSSYLYFGSYGTGVKPLITGLKTLTGLTANGNVWNATATGSVLNQKIVVVNGAIRAKGRYPNTGYLAKTSINSSTQITVPHSAIDYTGKELVIRTTAWVTEVTKVASDVQGATTDVLNFTTPVSTANMGNGGYFYQNGASLLDTLNEWSIDASNVISVYATSQPTVQYSTLDTLVSVPHYLTNVVLDGLSFTGANTMAVYYDSTRYDTVKNCSFNNNYVGLYLHSIRGFGIVKDSIQNSLNNGYFTGPDTSLYVYNTYVHNTGIFAGMGGNNDYSDYAGGFSYGRQARIENTQFINSGYHGVRFTGQFDTFYHVLVDTFCFTKQDGGGIYTFGNGGRNTDSGSLIRSCIVSHGIGASQGISGGDYVAGIYLDNYSYYITVDSSTVSYVSGISDITMHSLGNTVTNNILFDNLSSNMTNSNDEGNLNGGTTIKNNIMFNFNPSYQNLAFVIYGKDSIETVDNNYYMAPYSTGGLKFIGGGYKTFAQWKSYFPNYDLHSTETLPSPIMSLMPTLYSNPTTSVVTVNFSGGWIDAKGVSYNNAITLQPFQSALLWPSTAAQIIQYKTRFRNIKL